MIRRLLDDTLATYMAWLLMLPLIAVLSFAAGFSFWSGVILVERIAFQGSHD